MKKYISHAAKLIIFGLLISASACKEEFESDFSPLAFFTFETSNDNAMQVSFSNNSRLAASVKWDFGDSKGTSTELDPTYTYESGGQFTVTLTAIGEDGKTGTYKKTVTVEPYDAGVLDMENWTIQASGGSGISITVEGSPGGSKINFSGTGGWTGSHIYQQVAVEAGTYRLSGQLVVTSVIDETWCELIFSDNKQPQPNQDYSPGIPYQVIYSTWNGSPKNAGTYDIAAFNKGGVYPVDGLYTFDAPKTFYFVIKSGSNQPYTMAYKNLSFKKVE
jgi:PKD repeat protein